MNALLALITCMYRRLELLEHVELDSRRDLEKQNAELKSSLAKNTSKLSK